jgi:hypothetical protein
MYIYHKNQAHLADGGVVDPKPTGKNKRVNKVGLDRPLSDENLQMGFV